MNYIIALAEKMDEMGVTIPGKDLSDPEICKEILKSIEALEKGKSAPMRLNDSQRDPDKVITCDFCEEVIPRMTRYLYTTKDDVETPYHDCCYPWPELEE